MKALDKPTLRHLFLEKRVPVTSGSFMAIFASGSLYGAGMALSEYATGIGHWLLVVGIFGGASIGLAALALRLSGLSLRRKPATAGPAPALEAVSDGE